MKYQPQHDLIDPDFPTPGTEQPVEDPDAPTDAYVFDEDGHTVLNPGEDPNARERARKPKMAQKWVMPAAFILSILLQACRKPAAVQANVDEPGAGHGCFLYQLTVYQLGGDLLSNLG